MIAAYRFPARLILVMLMLVFPQVSIPFLVTFGGALLVCLVLRHIWQLRAEDQLANHPA